MAQFSSSSKSVNKAENLAVSVALSGLTTLLVMSVERMSRLGFEMAVSVNALDQFQVSARTHPNAPFFLLSSAITAAPAGLFLFATGTLATQGVGTGAFVMDCRGLYEIKVEASCAVGAGTVSAYAEATAP
jgi:hypothetical protein